MIRNLLFVLGYIVVLVGILKLNALRWEKSRRRQQERLSTRLGEDPKDLVALMKQIEPLWSIDPAKAQQILEAHYKAARERAAG
jgi:hypothetical protein